MAQYQVTCITKPNPMNSHEHITHIGNSFAGWKITREEAIRRIESKTDSFYVIDPKDPRKSSWVGVVNPIGRSPYIRTYADGDWNDNLLSLDQC